MGLLSLLVCGSASAAAALQIDAPGKVPTGASQVVSHDFLGYGIESTDFPNYSDVFAQNLLHSISTRIGSPVNLRIGGTSMDHSIFDPSQQQAVFAPNGTSKGLLSNFTFGRPWFDGFANLKNVTYTMHFALARDHGKNYTNAVEFTQRCIDAMGPEKLHAVAIGNEPDLFATQDQRSPSYGPAEYVDEAKTYMSLLKSNVSGIPSGRAFQIFDRSSEDNRPRWTIENFMGNATAAKIDFSKVSTVAAHYYQASGGDDIQKSLLNHSHTKAMTDAFFKPSLTYLKQHNPNLAFAVDEVGCALGKNSTGQPDFHLCSSLGSAIWTVDWILYTMTTNVTRVNMQLVKEAPFSAWLPVQFAGQGPPHVQGSWYGEVLVAEFIGPDKSSVLQIAELGTDDADISAYAGYHGGKLARVAITNQKLWLSGAGGGRPPQVMSVGVAGVPDGTDITVKRLTGPSGDALTGMTYAGLDWPYEKKGMEVQVKNDTEVVKVSKGSVNVTVQATEAVLLSWDT